jgi:hypothetical protein
MKIAFVAGFGPITSDNAASIRFWRDDMALPLTEIAPEYWGTDDLPGVNAFAAWPLAEAAESCFGTKAWPDSVPAPQAWIEMDVLSPDEVGVAAAKLEAARHTLLKQPATRAVGPDRGPAPESRGDAGGHHLHPVDARARPSRPRPRP